VNAPRPGQAAELVHLVGDSDTATAIGSGDVPVLATPRVLAWMEAASVGALADTLAGGDTSVGSAVELEHLVPSPIGTRVTVRAEVTAVDGRNVRFAVVASHPDGSVVASGWINRVIVDRTRFLSRAGGAGLT
jgi:fluoroacetyl-CoA thioesterase